MQTKALDVDVDLGIFDVQQIGASPVLTFDAAPEGANAPMATVVAPNAKCQSCYHYQDHKTACAIGTYPSKCGIGDDAEHGYAPLVMNPDAAEAWKEKRKGTAARGGHAEAGIVQQPKVDFKIQILGDSALHLSEKNPLRKAEYRPPQSWLRFMARAVNKGENSSIVAADIWWSRMSEMPARFEKGLFQDVMTRLPTEAEVARAEARTRQPEGVSKSQWRKQVIKSTHLRKGDADAPLSSGDEKPVLRTEKAKSFYADLKKKQTPADKSKIAAVGGKKKETPSGGYAAKKSLSVYDFRDTMGGKNGDASLKGDELETYLQSFVEACGREEYRDLKCDYESKWYRTNNGPKMANPGGVGTWGDIEAAKEIVNSKPPAYMADTDEISRRVWQRLVAKLPTNKNLLSAKRSLGVTQENIKMRLKSVTFGV